MRIANFRDDVLWPVAIRLGLDPSVQLLPDQAEAIAVYVNSWVRRTYDPVDLPELVNLDQFAPDSFHYVPYNAAPRNGHGVIQIAKVYKVYLVDPMKSIFRPIDTPFRLRTNGIHVGFEHGSWVWIKYQVTPPKFTAKPWDRGFVYSKDALTYSPVTGQCYKSAVNNNRGHDPAGGGVMTNGNSEVSILGEITQQYGPPNGGIASQHKIMVIGFTGTDPGPDPAPTPAAGGQWSITVTDAAGATLATATHTASGSETLAAIVTALQGQLNSALTTFVSVVADTTALTITLEDDSDFKISQAVWLNTSTPFPTSRLPVTQRQLYLPAVAPTAGQAQIYQMTLTAQQTIPNALYSITVNDLDGVPHTVQYLAAPTDSANQILANLATQIQNSADPYFATVLPSLNTVTNKLSLQMADPASVDTIAAPPPPPSYWTLVQFPYVLIDPVVRGAYADALKEEGQTDKGSMEEKTVPTEVQAVAAPQMGSQYDAVTDQQQRKSRYSGVKT